MQAAKADWRKYEESRPRLVIRLDREEKEALDAAARAQNLNISRMVSDFLRPVALAGTAEGRRAHQIITAAIQASIAWNSRHGHGFGDTTPVKDQNGYPLRDEWRRHDIDVYPRITKGGGTVLYHVVTHRMGESRMAAIRRYADLMIRAWADADEDHRDGLLAEIGDADQHRFIIGYANFREWTSFPEAYEMRLHYGMHQAGAIATPSNSDESTFMDWARGYLRDRWQHAGKPVDGVVTIASGEWGRDFKHYPIHSDAENIDAWAGVWLDQYRQCREGLTHDETLDYMAQMRIRIRLMTFDTE